MDTKSNSAETESVPKIVEYDDLLDYDSMDLMEEEFKDIINIRSLSDTASDKLTFTLFLFNVMITGYLLGCIPQYFYYWHSVKSITLLLMRWCWYKSKGWHYYMIDFCYFTNILILIYFWSPWKPSLLFPTIFIFSNGPLVWAIATWGNSLVPHSIDKMTSVFIHFSPAAVTWAVRWHSLEEQNFILCSDPTEPGPNGCNHLGWMELLMWPIIIYTVWLSLYIFIVLIWRKKRIEDKQYRTSVRYMAEDANKKSLTYKLVHVFGSKYSKMFYFIWQTVHVVLSMGSAYLSYHWMGYGMIVTALMLLFSCYNGSIFYIDVMGHKYYEEKEK